MGLSRRQLLQSGTVAAGALAVGPGLIRAALAAPARAGRSPYGALGAADANALELPPGFSSRLIARGLEPVAGTGYTMPIFPDGQATFRTGDGGWILVTNSESLAAIGAGASAIRFDIIRRDRPRPTGSSAGRTRTAPAGRPRGGRGCPARRPRTA